MNSALRTWPLRTLGRVLLGGLAAAIATLSATPGRAADERATCPPQAAVHTPDRVERGLREARDHGRVRQRLQGIMQVDARESGLEGLVLEAHLLTVDDQQRTAKSCGQRTNAGLGEAGGVETGWKRNSQRLGGGSG